MMRLTEQEQYTQRSTGLKKCERCQRMQRNWRGVAMCEIPGMSPKRCGIHYRPNLELIRQAAEELFK